MGQSGGGGVTNDFARDDAWQKAVRDKVLAPGFYGTHATDGRYVFIDKGRLATRLQREYAVDTILQGKHGAAVCIEEKIVRWPGYNYSCYALETESCTRPGREKEGWMHYGQADFLLYCFVQPDALECHLIDFQALKEWFWPLADEFDRFGPLTTLNASAGRKVPIRRVEAGIGVVKRRLFPDLSDSGTAALFGRAAA